MCWLTLPTFKYLFLQNTGIFVFLTLPQRKGAYRKKEVITMNKLGYVNPYNIKSQNL